MKKIEKLKNLRQKLNPSLALDEALSHLSSRVTTVTLDVPLPEKGKEYFTEEDINSIVDVVQSKIRVPLDGYSPILGVDYFTDSDIQKIVKQSVAMIPVPKDGKNGRDGETPDTNKIVSDVLAKIKIPQPKDGISPNIDDIVKRSVDELKKQPINFKDIKGTEKLIEFLKLGGFRGGGGSGGSGTSILLQTDGIANGSQTILNLIAGTNIILTDNGVGGVTIDSSGGGGTPGGSSGALQYNNAGAFGGFGSWDGATLDLDRFAIAANKFIITDGYSSPSNQTFQIYGSTLDAYLHIKDLSGGEEALLDFSLIPTNTQRTYALPNASGTLALTSDIPGISLGTTTQIPYTNAGGTDFDYSANLTFNGGTLTITGGINQGGDSVLFDIAGGDLFVRTSVYTDGLLYINNGGQASLGDWLGDINFTHLFVDDTTQTITYNANNGHTFTGDVTLSGKTTGSVLFAGTAGLISEDNTAFFWNNTDKYLHVGDGVTTLSTDAGNGFISVKEVVDSYFVALAGQNTNNGTSSSTDIVLSNDIGTDTTNYIDLGINSSTYSDPAFSFQRPNDGYLYITGGNLGIGTLTSKSIDFFTGGFAGSNRRMTITSSGNFGFGTIAPNNFMSIAPLRYSTGTASQSGTTITGVGTTWTSTMLGNLFEFDDGTIAGTITGFTSTTSITVSVSQTVASQTYSIHYPGIEVSSTGAVGLGTTTPTAKLDVVTNNLVTTQTNLSGIVLSNNTLATSGVVRQISPAARWRANAWKSNATAASQTVDFRQWANATNGTATVTGDMVWESSINGGAYTTLMGLGSSGVLTFYTANTRVIDVSASSTSIIGLRIQNSNNSTASSIARNEITVGGSSGGDPQTNYVVSGATDWVTGIDNSDSDSFKLSQNSTIGTNDRFIMTTAGLFSLRAGLSTKRATVGGGIKEYFTSVGNVTTGEDDLFTYTTEANIFGTNGDNIRGEYSGTTAANANTKTLKLYFAGTVLLDSGALLLSDNSWKFKFTIIRVSSTVVRYSVEFVYDGAATSVLKVGELTGLTLSGTNILKITGEATSTDDIVATMGTVTANPASI